LLSAIERQQDAPTIDRLLGRSYAVIEAADILLTNAVAHCAEALSKPPTVHNTRRAVVPSRRNLAALTQVGCINEGCSDNSRHHSGRDLHRSRLRHFD